MGKPPPQSTMHKKKNEKEQKEVAKQCVLHSTKTSQLCKFVLIEDFVEDVDVCTDLMK
jgi:hypothetical protein